MSGISKSHLCTIKDLPMIADLAEKELQRRLNLYQIFLKLYEHHDGLLEQILQLENLNYLSSQPRKPSYVQGVVDISGAYLITNLGTNQTQKLWQTQQIWTIGRDHNNGISIDDKYVSRRHAAIQYIDQKGFYLLDFRSTNGSTVNQKPVFQPVQLQDGDRLRVGSTIFDFYCNYTSKILPTVAVELLMQLVRDRDSSLDKAKPTIDGLQKQRVISSDITNLLPDPDLMLELDHLMSKSNLEHKSEILDRFFSQNRFTDVD